MSYKRSFYGGILLDEEKLKQNNIYHNIEVEYYKITNDKNTLFNGKTKIYGIEVIMKEHLNNNIITENEKIESLTKNEQIVEKVLGKLKENQVTPTTFKDIIEDMFN